MAEPKSFLLEMSLRVHVESWVCQILNYHDDVFFSFYMPVPLFLFVLSFAFCSLLIFLHLSNSLGVFRVFTLLLNYSRFVHFV